MCEFCDLLERHRKAIEVENYQRAGNARLEVSVAVVEKTFYGDLFGGIAVAYKDIDGFRTKGYDLNFCPECGKPLKKRDWLHHTGRDYDEGKN